MEVFKLVGRLTLDGVKSVTDNLDNLGAKAKKTGDSMKKLGQNMTKNVTAPIGALGAGAVVMATRFDDSMRKVQATLGDGVGATAEEAQANMEALRDEAKRLGSTTAFSASQAAGGMEKLALAGWDTNEILEATGPMLNLASAAGMELSTAADIVTDTMSAFGMTSEEATKATDIFAATSSSANTDVAQLGEAMKYVGASANAAGMDLVQTNAILGKLADQGLKGSTGGTVLAGMLREVQAEAKDGAVAIGDTSVAVYDANGDMRAMADILADVEDATKDMTQEQRNQALSSIWGAEAIRGVNIILEQGTDSLKDFEGELRNSDGTAQEMKDTMEGGLGGAFRSLMSATEGLAITFGETLAPYVQKLAEYLTELAQKFSNLNEDQQKVVVIVGLVVAAIGPLLTVLGGVIAVVPSLVNGLRLIRVAMLAFNSAVLANPITWIIAAIVGLVAIGFYLYKNWDKVKAKILEIWDSVKEKFGEVMDWIGEKVDDAKQWLADKWESIKQTIQEKWQSVLDFFTGIWESIKQTFSDVINWIVENTWIDDFINRIITGFGEILEFFHIIFDMILAIFGAVFSAIWETVEPYVTAIWEFIVERFTQVKEFISRIWSAISGAIVGFVTNIYNKVVEWFTKVRRFASDLFERAKNAIVTKWENIRSSIATKLQKIWTAVKEKFDQVKEKMTAPIEKAKETISTILENIRTAFSNLGWELPSIKLPRVSVSRGTKTFLGKEIPVPVFDIEWFAKGGIFTGPSLIGVGEGSSNEAVVPLDGPYMKPFAEEIANQMPNVSRSEGRIEVPLYLDGKEVARAIAPNMDRQLERERRITQRGSGNR